jgi:predicted metal-dependent HD superfamily phosphohydrolase
LPHNLYYHGYRHTRDDVFPAAKRLAALAMIDDQEKLLLYTAALYHDSGFLDQYHRNEAIGARLASESLPKFGFNQAQIRVIGQIILATQLPQSPNSHLEAILCDADLDALGRADFFIVSHRLRLELAAYGHPTSVRDWYEEQLIFLRRHRYFTEAARTLRNRGKQKNVEEIFRLLSTKS